MSKKEQRPSFPTPAIDGFLEVTLSAVNTGLTLTGAARNALDVIELHEGALIESKKTNSDRKEIAYYNLGRIAAVNALLDIDKPDRKFGFSITG